MTALNTTLRWLVRAALFVGVLMLCYIVSQAVTRGILRTEKLSTLLIFGGTWIVPASALWLWNSANDGRQSALFYILSVVSISFLALALLMVFAMSQSFT
jgi:hypothetical protein